MQKFTSNVIPSLLLTLALVAIVFSVQSTNVDAWAGGTDSGQGGCCGGGGFTPKPTPRPTPTPTPTPTPDPTPILPVCVITATPSSITTGANSTLKWTTTRAISASINQSIGAVSIGTDVTRVVSPAGSITYTMTVRSSTGHTSSCAANVTVVPVQVPAPVCVLSVNPHTITRGGASQLTWTSQNTVSASFNQGIGSVAVNGNRSVSPVDTTNYTLTVTNSAGVTAVCNKTVTVEIPTPSAPICDSFTANASTVNRGQSSQLTWNTTNANSASINNGVGSVSVDGTFNVSPIQNTTYTLTAIGTNNVQVTCPVTVTVVQPSTAITCAANVNFSASPTTINRGNSSTLTWSTNGLTNVSINNGVNGSALSGSAAVSPNDSTTYTLTGTKGNETINCPVSINVNQPSGGGGGGGGSSSPKCTLKISDSKISLGERVTLKWDTTRATEITIKDNHGKTLIDTDDKSSSEKKDLYDGEITIRPDKDTTYTLVASKGSRDKTCKVSVDVEDTVVVTQIRDQQPLVTGIALTQVPYTGFEAGPFMTSVFFTLLAAWALYMAYVLVGRRNGMSAFTPATVLADITPETTLFPEQVTTVPAFYQAPAAVVASTATVGYAAHTDVVASIEAQAHQAHVLLSADALAHIASITSEDNVAEVSTTLFALAKESFPSEDGYVTLTNERLTTLLA